MDATETTAAGPQNEAISALDDALCIAKAKGWSVAQFAERIGAAASAPPMWRKRGSVPAEYCPAIERETGVRCERLRRTVAWDVLRMQTAPVDAGA